MEKFAQSEQLADAFQKHRGETEGQIDRLEQVFELLEKPPRAKMCQATQGIIEEATEVAQEFKGSEALDAGIIAAAQAVEHYEIARYGSLKSWAAQLGMNEVVKLLDATLQEEKKTDSLLTQLAEQQANKEAA